MYCDQCGNELKPEDKYCPDCGKAVIQLSGKQATKKSRKVLWITLISLIAVIAIAFAVYMLFFRNIGTVMLLGRAFNNLSAETEERYNGSPLPALEALNEIMEDGSITADFTYTASLLGGWISIDINGKIKLMSDSEARNFALEAQIGAYGESIDLDFFMNKERMALRVHLLDNNFYGLNYDTFREDIRILGRQLGLDRETTDMYADIIDQINTAMNAEVVPDDIDYAYADIMKKFIRNIKISSKREKTDSESGTVINRAVTVTISKKALSNLLNDISKNEDAMKSQFNIHNTLFAQDENILYTDDFDLFMEEFNTFMNDFDRYYSGTIELVFLIDENERLTRIQTDSRIEYDGNSINFWVFFDFGNSVTDEWTFYLSYIDASDAGVNYINVKWDYTERSNNKINTIQFSTDVIEEVSLISEWNENSETFALTVADKNESHTISGVLNATDTNIHIILDEISFADSDNKLNIEITTQTGAQIKDIEYINIDRWGTAFIEAILGIITSIPFF